MKVKWGSTVAGATIGFGFGMSGDPWVLVVGLIAWFAMLVQSDRNLLQHQAELRAARYGYDP